MIHAHAVVVENTNNVVVEMPNIYQNQNLLIWITQILGGDNEEELTNEINEKVEALYCPLVQKSTED